MNRSPKDKADARTTHPLKLVEALAGLYPATFDLYHRKPLKIGIHRDLIATGVATAAEVSSALRYFSNGYVYLQASVAGAVRIDLNGQPAGVVTEAEALNASRTLARLKNREATKAVSKPLHSQPSRPVSTRPPLARSQRAGAGFDALRSAALARRSSQSTQKEASS